LVADAVGRFRQLARRLALVLEHVAGRAIELLLELIDLAGELILALAQLLRLAGARVTLLLIELAEILLDLLLLARHRFGLAQRVLDVAPGARRLRLLELALGFLQLLHRALRG